jgi:hypothetical protein
LSLKETVPGVPVTDDPVVVVGSGAVIGEEVFNNTVGTWSVALKTSNERSTLKYRPLARTLSSAWSSKERFSDAFADAVNNKVAAATMNPIIFTRKNPKEQWIPVAMVLIAPDEASRIGWVRQINRGIRGRSDITHDICARRDRRHGGTNIYIGNQILLYIPILDQRPLIAWGVIAMIVSPYISAQTNGVGGWSERTVIADITSYAVSAGTRRIDLIQGIIEPAETSGVRIAPCKNGG